VWRVDKLYCYGRAMQRINIASPSFERDPARPAGYRRGGLELGPLLGASDLGATVYELPPGESICPYHYELSEEEWLLVLTGAPTLRDPDGEHALEPLDIVCFPVGPAGAHKLTNATAAPVRVLLFSTKRIPALSVYPDSDKLGVWTGGEPGDLLVHRSAGVDYWSGE
jgi:uncharacterized cupin superfamily protein